MHPSHRLTVAAAITTITAAAAVAVPAAAQAETRSSLSAATSAPVSPSAAAPVSQSAAATPASVSQTAAQPITIASGTRYTAGENTVTGTASPGSELFITYQASFGTRYASASAGTDGTWSADVFLEVPRSTSTAFFTVSSVGGSANRVAARFTVEAPTVGSEYVPATLDWKYPIANSHGTRSGTGTPGAFLTLSWGFASASTIVAADGTWTVDVSTASNTYNGLAKATVTTHLAPGETRDEIITLR